MGQNAQLGAHLRDGLAELLDPLALLLLLCCRHAPLALSQENQRSDSERRHTRAGVDVGGGAVSGLSPRGSDARGQGHAAGKSPCCYTMGESPGRPLQDRGMHTCAQVCASGGGGQRAKRGVGSCWKTRLPNTRHTEGSCMCPRHLTTSTGAAGSWERAENSSPGPRTGPHVQASGLTAASWVTAS